MRISDARNSRQLLRTRSVRVCTVECSKVADKEEAAAVDVPSRPTRILDDQARCPCGQGHRPDITRTSFASNEEQLRPVARDVTARACCYGHYLSTCSWDLQCNRPRR